MVKLTRIDPNAFDVDGPGASDAGVFGLPYGAEESTVVLVPAPWEATTSYGAGTAGGPRAILEASPQLDLFDAELSDLGLGSPWTFGIHMLEPSADLVRWNAEAVAAARVRAGPGASPAVVNALSRRADQTVEHLVDGWAGRGKITGVVGGDHSVALGSILAAARRYPGLGILHLDAHADLRVAYCGFERSHASVMHNVLSAPVPVSALVQVGIRDLSEAEARVIEDDPRVTTFFDHRLRRALGQGVGWSELMAQIVDPLPEQIYVSVDIDVLDPSACPHTGTPVPGGLSFGQLMSLLAHVAESGRRVVGFDLVEVAPGPAGGEWDGNVGARVLYRLCGMALRSWGARDRV